MQMTARERLWFGPHLLNEPKMRSSWATLGKIMGLIHSNVQIDRGNTL